MPRPQAEAPSARTRFGAGGSVRTRPRGLGAFRRTHPSPEGADARDASGGCVGREQRARRTHLTRTEGTRNEDPTEPPAPERGSLRPTFREGACRRPSYNEGAANTSEDYSPSMTVLPPPKR